MGQSPLSLPQSPESNSISLENSNSEDGGHQPVSKKFRPRHRRSISDSSFSEFEIVTHNTVVQPPPPDAPQGDGVDEPDHPEAIEELEMNVFKSDIEEAMFDDSPPPRPKNPTRANTSARATVKGINDWQGHAQRVSNEIELCRSCSLGDLDKIGSKQKLRAKKSWSSPSQFRMEHLWEKINSRADVNALDKEGDAIIHIILKKKRKDKVDMLLTLLVNSKVEVNLPDSQGNTALHIAIKKEEVMCIKALIVFGADINKRNSKRFTPFDLVIKNGHLLEVECILIKLGAQRSSQVVNEEAVIRVPRMHAFAENMRPLRRQVKLRPSDKLSDFINNQGTRRLQKELQALIDQRRLARRVDEHMDYVIGEQQRELVEYNKTLQVGGSRMLFLDGGGIKGLVQLEVLMQIQEAAGGRPVDQLFDWIVGTSTGGVIALALVYGKKSLSTLRQLYFKLKDRVFANARYGFGYDSKALDDVLQEYLDPDIKMTDVSHPKVLVAAVNKATTNLNLHFFNNCFGDEYCDYPVWKVARYTSAAPLFFTEMDNYVDGGLVCNNPTEFGLTAIQNYCRKQDIELPISMIVSIGSGQNPARNMGIVNAHEALFFGKQWLRPDKLINMTQNLLLLLSNALLESEMVAENSKCRCRELNIPYFRFSPDLNDMISAGETDNEKLFSMVIKTKIDTKSQKLSELIALFHQIANAERNMKREPAVPCDPKPGHQPSLLCKEMAATLEPREEIPIAQQAADPAEKSADQLAHTEATKDNGHHESSCPTFWSEKSQGFVVKQNGTT